MNKQKRTSEEAFRGLCRALAEFGNALMRQARSDRRKLAKAFRKMKERICP